MMFLFLDVDMLELVRNLVAHGRGSEGETGKWSG